ncbi:MAG TPA: glycosyltransferase [Vicinamibacterales bacterium]|nr:glycosyltransferase [Vicinamibacterales bacterium]
MALRITHVTNEPFGLQMASGVQHVVYCLAREQAETGESVTVFTRDDQAVHVLGTDESPTPHRQLTCRRNRSLRERVLFRYFERRLTEDVLGSVPDIVHFHSIHIPENVVLAACLRRAGVPYCVTVHGGLFRPALRRRWLKKTLFNACFERRYLNEAQFIHALSPQETDVVRRHGVKRPIVMIPNGLPPDANTRATHRDALSAQHSWLHGQRVFMFLGRLDPWQKGLDLLLKAFARARLANAALVIVGPDDRATHRRLAKLAERLGISAGVLFKGAAFGPERADLLAAADIFVHPSRWEGVSLSVLAAAAAGKACLITRAADPLGSLEAARAAIIVEPNIQSIVAGLHRANAATVEELQTIGARARTVARAQFTWSAAAATLRRAYCGAADERRIS